MPRKNAKRLRILVTAGPTREWLDPVRFITNPSTGVMGYEIARAAKHSGMQVTLLSGPTSLVPAAGVRHIPFETTDDLDWLLAKEFPRHDLLFMTAAVGDYTPVSVQKNKIKRKSGWVVKFKQTQDLLAKLARIKRHQIVVGFCLETEDLIENALKKLKSKRLDFIAANYLGGGTQPFGAGKTNVILIDRRGRKKEFKNMGKRKLAERLIKAVIPAKSARRAPRAGIQSL